MLTNSLADDLPVRVSEIAAVVAPGSSAEPVDISRAQTLAMDDQMLRRALTAQGRGDDATVARVESELRDTFAAAILALFRVSAGLMVLAFLVT